MSFTTVMSRLILCVLLATALPICLAHQAGDPPSRTSLPTVSELEAKRQAIAESTELEEELRTQIEELYARAVKRLESSAASNRLQSQLVEELERATATIQDLQLQLEGFNPTRLNEIGVEHKTSEEISQKLADQNTEAGNRRAALDAVVAEISRRSERRGQLPSLRSTAQQDLESVERELAAAAPADEAPELTEARQLLLKIRRQALQSELNLIDQESRTYEPTTRLWSLKRDFAERQLKDTQRVVDELQALLFRSRQYEAQAAAREARIAAANAHPAVSDVARRNTVLAESSQEILRRLEVSRQKITESTELRDSLDAEFKRIKRRSEAAGFSQAIGILLRSQSTRLPNTAPIAARRRDRGQRIAETNLSLIEWEAERSQSPDPAEATETLLGRLNGDYSDDERTDIGTQLRSSLTQQRQLLSTLTDDGARLLDRLVALDSLDQELIQLVEDQSTYIAEHVLWVRSSEPFRIATARNSWQSASQMLTRSSWRDVIAKVRDDVVGQPVTWSAVAVLVLWMLSRRAGLRRAIREDGLLAARSSATAIAPTMRTLANSLLIAVLGPAVLWFAGWRIAAPPADVSLHSIGQTLQGAAILWFPVELFRQLIRPGGLCQHHFGWSAQSLGVVRRWLGTSMVVLIPGSLVVLLCEAQDDEFLHGGLERLSFVACMLILSVCLFQILRRGGVVLQEIHTAAPNGLLARSRFLWSAIIVLSPVALAILSLAGYHYSAIQMFRRLFLTDVLLISVIVIYFLLNRWLLVTYRRLAINRNRQRREALLKEAAEAAPDTPRVELAEAEGSQEVSLTKVNEQTQRLMKLGAGLCVVLGLWLIWTDVLPALGILRSVELWQNQIASTADGESAPWVTLADLVLAAGAGVLTLISTRNLPGLLEITILQRLPLDAGARYAASSVTRYLIAVVGTTVSCWLIGIGWSSVQWLIAAMTVGLGFGLQEIFANFVSGLILLFERPVRVGDTVTVNDITGTVSRIRIRATTIVDWDNRELIVPNRAFVTDNLINWTLTNTDVRMILKVGIAYGSDTRKATEILYRVMQENPEVLADPEPVVVFKEFGDSSLVFEARIFVTGLVAYRRLQHDLNMAIDDEFRKAGIEIAFPQRDLHVRSVSADMQFPGTAGPTGLPTATPFNSADQ